MKATALSVSLSATPVFKGKYKATVVIKSLKEVEGVSVKSRIWQKESLTISALRYGAALIAAGTKVRIETSPAPTAVY